MARTSFTKATLAILPLSIATLALTVACAQQNSGKQIKRSREATLQKLNEKVTTAFPFYSKDDAENLKLSAMVEGASAIVDAPEDKSLPIQAEVRILLNGMEKEIAADTKQLAITEGVTTQLVNIEDSPQKFQILVRCENGKTRCDRMAVLLTEILEDSKGATRATALYFARPEKADLSQKANGKDGKNAKNDKAAKEAEAKAAKETVVDNLMKLVWTANPKQGVIDTGVTYSVDEAKAKRSGVDVDKIKAQEKARREQAQKDKEQKEKEAAAAKAKQDQQSQNQQTAQGADPKTGAKTDQKTEPKADAKADAKPANKTDTKPDGKTDQKAQGQAPAPGQQTAEQKTAEQKAAEHKAAEEKIAEEAQRRAKENAGKEKITPTGQRIGGA